MCPPSIYCCPITKEPLQERDGFLKAQTSGNRYPIVDGIPDFFLSLGEDDAIRDEDPNRIWLDEEVSKAREIIYQNCSRKLRGMSFCVEEIARRVGGGGQLLEVAMGTGHFTELFAERFGAVDIYAFDYSWPLLKRALRRVERFQNVHLFRANARGRMPFRPGIFDAIFIRLAPFGRQGIPVARAAFDLLEPSGWFFEAGWKPQSFETPPYDWLAQNGYCEIEHHVWRYERLLAKEELDASRIEATAAKAAGLPIDIYLIERAEGTFKCTWEYLSIGQKPLQPERHHSIDEYSTR